MESQLSDERQAQLTDYAQRDGREPAVALDHIFAEALDTERQAYQEAVEGIRRGYADVEAGRTRTATEFLNELRAKRRFLGKNTSGTQCVADRRANQPGIVVSGPMSKTESANSPIDGNNNREIPVDNYLLSTTIWLWIS